VTEYDSDGMLLGYFNAHLFKYNPDSTVQCLYNYKLSNGEVSSAYVKYNGKDMTVYNDNEFRYAYNAFEAGT